jgi:hypothetical protein
MTADPAAADEVPARAARTLMELGDRSGEDFLLDAVRTARGRRRAAALRMINDWNIERRVSLDDPGRVRMILACLDDPDPEVVRAAETLCVAREIPGTEAKLVAMLKDGRTKELHQLAGDLARVAESPEAVRVLANALRDPGQEINYWTGHNLQRLIEHPDPKIAEPVRAALLGRALDRFKKPPYEQWVVRDLALAADRTTIPVLEDIAAKVKDPIGRMYAVQALTRLEPEHALDRALAFARAEKGFSLATSMLERLATKENTDRIVDAFLEIQRRDRPPIDLGEARLLLGRLGPRGRKAVEESMDRLRPDARAWAVWKLNGLDLNATIDDLRAAGLTTMGRDDILAKMRKSRRAAGEAGELDLTDPSGLGSALAWAGILTQFDTETDEIPCRHHELIMEFAENTGGRFDPECAVQAWHRKDQEDIEGPYTVRFLYKGRLYRFGAENRHDWYDVEAVVRALNFALATAGRPERFSGLETGDQTAAYVFADPEAFRPIAEKYGLILSKDPGAPERRGKEFERQVIDQLKKQGGP